MASKCNSCNNPILNAEFISCAGACKELFHIKCVAVNKSMLNAVNSCPNIHWYSHECNNGNRNISASIDRINDAIGVLTNSLSGDLIQFVNGVKTLTERFMETISTTIVPNGPSLIAVSCNTCSQDGNVRARNDNSISTTSEQSSCESKVKRSHFGARITTHYDREPSKGVVSNIGKDITVDYLTDYLVDELKIDKEKIGLSLLLPTGKTIEDLNFLQYKITIPEDKYSAIMCSESWPSNVRVRDFVYKDKRIGGVAKQHFLAKKILYSNWDSPSEDLS